MGNQTITFGSAPSVVVGGVGTVSAMASSGLVVSYSSLTPDICSTSGGTVTGVAVGSCAIAANQAGNSSYSAAAQVIQFITVIKPPQTITFAPLTAGSLAESPVTLAATAGSGLVVTFASSDSSVASISGTTVTLHKAGFATITASQAGNETWQAASDVIRTLTVTASGKPTLTVSTLAGGSVTRDATLNINGSAVGVNGRTTVTVNGEPQVLNSDNRFSAARSLVPGANLITTVATDTGSHSTTDSRTITLDQSAPGLTITAPVDTSSTARPLLTVTGSVDNDTDLVDVILNDGTPHSAIQNGKNLSSDLTLRAGVNTIQVTTTSLNRTSSSLVRTIVYDGQAPGVAITAPDTDITTDQSALTLTGTVTDALSDITVTITCDGLTYCPTVENGVFRQLLSFTAAKTYAIVVTTVDLAGNQVTVQRNVIYRPMRQITITTNPVGRTMLVDNVPVVSPQTFNWSEGSAHTIAIDAATQYDTPGTRYTFASWSDGGAASHAITSPATGSVTYTANFSAQYQLTTTAGTGGTVLPATGNWYNAGASVSIIATATSGYAFSSWSLTSGSGPINNPYSAATTVAMNGPTTVTANIPAISTNMNATITGKSGTIGGSRTWTVSLTNTGGATATAARVDGLTVSTSGTCKPAVASSFPATVGDIPAGASRSVPVTVKFTGCAGLLKFSVNISYSAAGAVGGITPLTGVTQ